MTTTVAAAMMATPMATTTMAMAMVMMILFCHGGHAGTPPFHEKLPAPKK